jgi:hypothetical protein
MADSSSRLAVMSWLNRSRLTVLLVSPLLISCFRSLIIPYMYDLSSLTAVETYLNLQSRKEERLSTASFGSKRVLDLLLEGQVEKQDVGYGDRQEHVLADSGDGLDKRHVVAFGERCFGVGRPAQGCSE